MNYQLKAQISSATMVYERTTSHLPHMLETSFVMSFVFYIVNFCLQSRIMKSRGICRRFRKNIGSHLVSISLGPWMAKPHLNDLVFEWYQWSDICLHWYLVIAWVSIYGIHLRNWMQFYLGCKRVLVLGTFCIFFLYLFLVSSQGFPFFGFSFSVKNMKHLRKWLLKFNSGRRIPHKLCVIATLLIIFKEW